MHHEQAASTSGWRQRGGGSSLSLSRWIQDRNVPMWPQVFFHLFVFVSAAASKREKKKNPEQSLALWSADSRILDSPQFVLVNKAESGGFKLCLVCLVKDSEKLGVEFIMKKDQWKEVNTERGREGESWASTSFSKAVLIMTPEAEEAASAWASCPETGTLHLNSGSAYWYFPVCVSRGFGLLWQITSSNFTRLHNPTYCQLKVIRQDGAMVTQINTSCHKPSGHRWATGSRGNKKETHGGYGALGLACWRVTWRVIEDVRLSGAHGFWLWNRCCGTHLAVCSSGLSLCLSELLFPPPAPPLP